jgi:hypothetical protein
MFSISVGKPPRPFWLLAIEAGEYLPKCAASPDIKSFLHIPYPERLSVFKTAQEQWERNREAFSRDREAYFRSVYSDPKYKQAAREFLDRQMREPQLLHEVVCIGHTGAM